MSTEKLLRVKNLKAHLPSSEGVKRIVDGIDFEIKKGETLGLAGESGAGKTVTAFSILRLIKPTRAGGSRIVSDRSSAYPALRIDGEVWYKGRNLMKLSDEELEDIRGKEISMIFQNPIPALHPIYMIGYQTGETVEAHTETRISKIKELVEEYLGKVDLADVKRRYRHHPSLFSGGEGQRIMIAMALICGPSLLIADEPTSSLDVLVQRNVLELIKRMKKEFDLTMLYITHDFGIIAEVSDCVAVMYAGKIMEYGEVKTIFKNSKHPYTRGLIRAYPPPIYSKEKWLPEGIPGQHPNPLYLPSGCRFNPRCRYVKPICVKKEPSMIEIEPEHFVSCHRASEM